MNIFLKCATGRFQLHTIFQTVLINVGILHVGQIFFDTPTESNVKIGDRESLRRVVG